MTRPFFYCLRKYCICSSSSLRGTVTSAITRFLSAWSTLVICPSNDSAIDMGKRVHNSLKMLLFKDNYKIYILILPYAQRKSGGRPEMGAITTQRLPRIKLGSAPPKAPAQQVTAAPFRASRGFSKYEPIGTERQHPIQDLGMGTAPLKGFAPAKARGRSQKSADLPA